MSKNDMSALLKSRMIATQQASELEVGNEAYETLFQAPSKLVQPVVRKLPIGRLRPFFTADIGFKPYPAAKLQALAEHMKAEGQFERIIVRPIPNSEDFEILSGHNRTNAGKLNNWSEIEAEIVEADDERATTIAISTNLLRRQDLTIIERGQAYKTLLEAQRRQGFRSDIVTSGEFRQKLCGSSKAETSGESRQKLSVEGDDAFGEVRQRYSARKIVAEFFGVTEYEIRKAIKMTQLITELQSILEEHPKMLPLSCAEKIADYNADSQQAFTEMCSIEGYQLNIATVNYIVQKCPPPCADQQAIFAAWREARAAEERRAMRPPKKLSFDRKKFIPYIEKAGGDAAIEKLFLEFLSSHFRENN